MSELIRLTEGPAATEAIGSALGGVLVAGDLLGLDGDLGAGKTCLVRGIAVGMGIDPDQVASPTFVLHRVYSGSSAVLHHVDAYRLGPDADLQVLDLDSLLDEGPVVVEWAEYARFAPHQPVRVEIDIVADDERRIRLQPDAPERFRIAFTAAETPR